MLEAAGEAGVLDAATRSGPPARSGLGPWPSVTHQLPLHGPEPDQGPQHAAAAEGIAGAALRYHTST
jgi:hypothetical protein